MQKDVVVNGTLSKIALTKVQAKDVAVDVEAVAPPAPLQA